MIVMNKLKVVCDFKSRRSPLHRLRHPPPVCALPRPQPSQCNPSGRGCRPRALQCRRGCAQPPAKRNEPLSHAMLPLQSASTRSRWNITTTSKQFRRLGLLAPKHSAAPLGASEGLGSLLLKDSLGQNRDAGRQPGRINSQATKSEKRQKPCSSKASEGKQPEGSESR